MLYFNLFVPFLGCLLTQCAVCQQPDVNENCKVASQETKGASLLATKQSVKSVLMRDESKPESNAGALLPTSRHASCQYTFLDLGANSGDTVNAFLHAEGLPISTGELFWDPRNPTTADFDYRYFQNVLKGILNETKSTVRDYCAIGIEANDAWSTQFAKFKSQNDKSVQYLGMHAGLAIGLKDGPMDFQCAKVDPAKRKWAEGQPDEDSSEQDQYPCKIKSRSLPSILNEFRGRHSKVLIVKMDVESMMNTIMPQLLQSGSLEALSADGMQVYMLVDWSHMSKKTARMLNSFKKIPNVRWQAMTVGSAEQSKAEEETSGGTFSDTPSLR